MHALAQFRAARAHAQSGVALAMAMIVLIILTLLGVAAMRAARLELRLSNNSQSQLSALQQAQSFADTVVSFASNIAIQPGTDYYLCYSAPAPAAPSNPPTPSSTPASSFSASGGCLSSYTGGSITYTSLGALTLASTTASSGVVNPLPNNAYAEVVRNDPEFIPASAVRGAETSGRSFDFASFSVIAGYDNTKPVDGSNAVTSASQPSAGASEVNEGEYVRHNKATGVTYQ